MRKWDVIDFVHANKDVSVMFRFKDQFTSIIKEMMPCRQDWVYVFEVSNIKSLIDADGVDMRWPGGSCSTWFIFSYQTIQWPLMSRMETSTFVFMFILSLFHVFSLSLLFITHPYLKTWGYQIKSICTAWYQQRWLRKYVVCAGFWHFCEPKL